MLKKLIGIMEEEVETDKQAVYSKQEPEKSEENVVETEDKTDES